MSQVLFRLSRWENLEYAEKIWPGYEGPCGLSRGRSHLGGKYVDAPRVPGSSPKASVVIRFIDEYRDRFSVEFICTTLKNNWTGGFITSRGCRQSTARGLSARRLRDAVLVERISAVHQANYGVLGVRKMWHALRRDRIDIGREHTARLMRLAGGSGKGTGRSLITTRKANVPDLCPDLVQREFKV